MCKTNPRLWVTCVLFLLADCVAWFLSYGRLFAIRDGRCPDAYAFAEGSLASAGLFWAFDLAGQLKGWPRLAFILMCGVIPVAVRRAY